MEKKTLKMGTAEKNVTKNDETTQDNQFEIEPPVQAVKSISVEINQDDANSLSIIHDYLHSRPMNETEQGVFFLRGLLKKINESA